MAERGSLLPVADGTVLREDAQMPFLRSRALHVVSVAAILLSMLLVGPQTAMAGLCGEFRWPIKSLADADRRDIDFDARRTTLARLYHLDPPRRVREDAPRMAPHEFRTYSVIARLVKGEIEGDTDVKFVVSIPGHPERTMAVEFLGRPCMTSTFRRHRMLAARRKALRMCGPLSEEFTELRGRVRLTGVGFWGARRHEEIGGAPNHFELIPVLGIRGTCRQA